MAFDPSQQTRREFCELSCRALSLFGVAVLAEACGGSPTSPSGVSSDPLPTVSGSVVSGRISVAVDAVSPLGSVGSVALVQSSGVNVLVARTGQETFSTLTATCTHEGCTITGHNSDTFVCPCHGSQFNATGGVVGGPASRPLRQFSNQLSGEVLLIAVT